MLAFAFDCVFTAIKVMLGVGLVSAVLVMLVLVPFGLWIATLEWWAQFKRRRQAAQIKFP